MGLLEGRDEMTYEEKKKLIDADELLEKKEKLAKTYSTIENEDTAKAAALALIILQALVNETTIINPEDLRPKGKWKLNEDGKWACTFCGGLAVEHPEKPDTWQALTTCCPNCGAKMEG